MADDGLILHYGQKIRLATVSAYVVKKLSSSSSSTPAPTTAVDNTNALLGIGYYEKNGRHGILSCVPPLGEKLDHLFNEDEFLVLDPMNQRESGDPVEYGHPVVLVNQHGMVWNNKTGGITGYVGPRPRNIAGEMYVSFQQSGSTNVKSKDKSNNSNSDRTTSAPALMTGSERKTATNSSTTGSTTVPSSVSSTNLTSIASNSSSASVAMDSHAVSGGPVRFGDSNVTIAVVESNRHSQMFNKRLSNFKKPTSKIVGGYICCDGKGSELRFTICPTRPKIEQISMMNKLITSYQYGQKIALPLALLESTDKGKQGNNSSNNNNIRFQQAEIFFRLSNQTTAVLPGKLLQQKLVAHAATDHQERNSDAPEKESIFVLPLRNGPGELVAKLTGIAPKKLADSNGKPCRCAPNTTAACCKAIVLPQRMSIFYKSVDALRLIPVPLFALLYAILTHFLWSSLNTMEDGLKRELVVLVLVVFPAFYVAVKVDHPFSYIFHAPPVEHGHDDEPQANGTLKLIVTEYRFTPSDSSNGAVAVSTASRPSALEENGTMRSSSAASNGIISSGPAATTLTIPNRFVLAEKGDEAKALVRYQETLAWRQEERLDEILATPSPYFKTIKANYPHYYHKRGKNDEPVYYEKPGKINLKALKGAGLTLDDLMHNYIMVTEFLWQIIEPDDNKKCISVVDVEGIGISDFAGEAVEYVRKAAAVSGKHYPERCAYIFVINVPSWFSMIWNTVKGMVDEVTREKVIIVRGKKKILDALAEKIPIENIPEEYGGMSDGSSPEEVQLCNLMAYLNKDEDAPATNPIAGHVRKK